MSKKLSKLLSPLAWPWRGYYRLRRFLYNYDFISKTSFDIPVISVGNVSFGGTGKTPFCLWILNYYQEKARNVVVLTRGYKGKFEKSVGVLSKENYKTSSPTDFGDEALILGRNLKKESRIMVGRNRSQNMLFHFNKMNPDICLLDDGFQHLKISRDLNVVLFDSMMSLDRYQEPPLGYLREGMNSLKDADLVVLGRCDQVDANKLSSLEDKIKAFTQANCPVLKTHYKPKMICDLSHNNFINCSGLKGKSVVAVAGIASPESFFELLKSLGANILEEVVFPDHHIFEEKDLETMLGLSVKYDDAIILTTEKDAVKFIGRVPPDKAFYLKIELAFLEGEQLLKEKLDTLLKL